MHGNSPHPHTLPDGRPSKDGPYSNNASLSSHHRPQQSGTGKSSEPIRELDHTSSRSFQVPYTSPPVLPLPPLKWKDGHNYHHVTHSTLVVSSSGGGGGSSGRGGSVSISEILNNSPESYTDIGAASSSGLSGNANEVTLSTDSLALTSKPIYPLRGPPMERHEYDVNPGPIRSQIPPWQRSTISSISQPISSSIVLGNDTSRPYSSLASDGPVVIGNNRKRGSESHDLRRKSLKGQVSSINSIIDNSEHQQQQKQRQDQQKQPQPKPKPQPQPQPQKQKQKQEQQQEQQKKQQHRPDKEDEASGNTHHSIVAPLSPQSSISGLSKQRAGRLDSIGTHSVVSSYGEESDSDGYDFAEDDHPNRTRGRDDTMAQCSGGSSSKNVPSAQRERNRVAATKCRAKTKATISRLEEAERIVSDKRNVLIEEKNALLNEVLSLRLEILQHSHCETDGNISNYLHNAARMIGQTGGTNPIWGADGSGRLHPVGRRHKNQDSHP